MELFINKVVKSGKKWEFYAYIYTFNFSWKKMVNLIGEFDCKIDVKGRIMMPSALKKQIPPESEERFVINRGFEKCLVLYPMSEWKERLVYEEEYPLSSGFVGHIGGFCIA